MPSARAAWRAAWRRTATMIVQGLPIAAALFVLFPRLASPLWGLPADRAAATGLVRSDVAGLDQRTVAVRRGCVSRRFRRRSAAATARYWRGPVLSLFNGREWRALSPRAGGRLREAQRAARPLHGDARAERSSMAVRARFSSTLPRDRRRRGARASAGGARRLLARTAAPDARAGDAAAALHASSRCSSTVIRSHRRAKSQHQSRGCRPATRAPSISRASCARDIPDDRRYIGAVLQWFRDEPFFYTLAPPLLEEASRSTSSCSTRGAASASTSRARSSCCCARPAFRRASSPATRAARSIRAAAT